MAQLHQLHSEDDRIRVRELWWEYLQWANRRVNEEFGISFRIAEMIERDMAALHIFAPPRGRLILATEESLAVGIAALKPLQDNLAEIKRMYVRPAFRRKGIGKTLLLHLISEARQIGYRTIRLDSARFMDAAHALYRSVGFRQIDPFPESEIPTEFWQHWLFMEKQLEESAKPPEASA